MAPARVFNELWAFMPGGIAPLRLLRSFIPAALPSFLGHPRLKTVLKYDSKLAYDASRF